MKWFIAVWLLGTGMGVSFSVVKERNARVVLLKEKEHSLKKLAYYMYQWKMSAEEAFRHVAQEEKGSLQAFYQAMQEALEQRRAENIDTLWQEMSSLYLKEEWFTSKSRQIWQTCFQSLPMEPEAVNRKLLLLAEEMAFCRRELEAKYKGEQKLVLTLGVFVGAFLCLVLW